MPIQTNTCNPLITRIPRSATTQIVPQNVTHYPAASTAHLYASPRQLAPARHQARSKVRQRKMLALPLCLTLVLPSIMATPGALATVNPNELIELIANGAITQHIARELGVHHSSLYRQLAKHPEYAAARECGMEARLDNAELAIHEADECTLPRAREVWRAVTWRAERECSHRWGAKSQVTVDHRIDLQVTLSVDAASLLDSLRTVSSAPHSDDVRITDVMLSVDSQHSDTSTSAGPSD
jgi:hypothetical protein